MQKIRSALIVGLLTTAGLLATPLDYAPVKSANPLKGFLPYARDYGPDALPHSMEFFYVPLRELMHGPEHFAWDKLDARLDPIAARGHQAVFRVVLDYPTKKPGIPDFILHGPDGIGGTADDLEVRPYTEHGNRSTSLSPDYADPFLRSQLLSFIAALGARYDGDPRIGFVQMGLLGFWGEWHTHPHAWMPSLEMQREILRAYDDAFDRTQLLVRVPKHASFREFAMGYHDDSFAYTTLPPPNWHFLGQLEEHGEHERWQTHAIGGEIRPENQPGMWEDPASVPAGQDFDLCVAATHASWMLAYGPFTQNLSPAARDLAERQSRSLGYEFQVTSAAIQADPGNASVRVRLTVRNTGVAPFYYPWPLELAVLNAAGDVVHTERADWTLDGLLPREPDRVWTHTLDVRAAGSGEHRVLLRVVNPLTGGLPLRFANRSQDADRDGWLTLGRFAR